MKPRIKLVHIVPSLNIGGRENAVLEVIRALNKNKFDVNVCCLRRKGTLYESFAKEGINIHFMGNTNGIDLTMYFKLSKFLKDHRYDIVHTHNPGAFIYGTLGAKLAGISLIVNTEHGYGYKLSWRKKVIEHVLRNFISVTIAVSEDLRLKLSRGFMCQPADIVTIYNGIDMERFSKHDSETKNLRKHYGFNLDDKIIGIVARLVEVKDHKTLLKAMQICLNEMPSLKLLIVGDGPLMAELQKYTMEIGLQENVICMGERTDVNKLMAILDLFILSSTSEGISMTLLEAMASGKPVVATSVGGNPEVVKNGKTGLLVPSKNPQAMAEAILGLLNDQSKLILFGQRGRERVKEAFCIRKTIKSIENLYENLMLAHKAY